MEPPAVDNVENRQPTAIDSLMKKEKAAQKTTTVFSRIFFIILGLVLFIDTALLGFFFVLTFGQSHEAVLTTRQLVPLSVGTLVISLAALAVFFFISRRTAFSISEPLTRITEAAPMLAGGQFDLLAGSTSFQEIQKLETVLSAAAEKIKRTSEQLETDLEKRSNDVKLANEIADSANRLKGEFLANMSHEIRTPLNSIIGFAEILADMVEGEKEQNYLTAILSSGQSLLELINEILDLAKIDSGRLELDLNPVNVVAVLKDIKRIFEIKVQEKGLDFYLDIDPSIPIGLLMDELRLRQILFNLLGNAVKFTESGFISLSVNRVYTQDTHSTIDMVFSVQDSGIGIPEDQLKDIFDVFMQRDGQTTNKYGGTGLGLSLSQRLIHMMDGEITVESEVGQGSIFMIILKNIHVATFMPYGEENKDVEEDICFEQGTVLIVDDVEANRSLLKSYLEAPTLTIIEAVNGKEAIEKAERYHPDLILMDVKMPVMDGLEATRIIKARENLKSIPVEIVTASVMKKNEAVYRSVGDGFLKKPVSKVQLLKEVKRFIPHTLSYVVEKKKSISDLFLNVQMETLPIRILEHLPKAVAQLESRIMRAWERVQDRFIFTEIEDFAGDVMKLGEEFELDILKKWAGVVQDQVECFNMEELPDTIEMFPKLVERLAALADPHPKG